MSHPKITIPGFQFAGIHCGIKDNPRKKDLSVIYSEEPRTLMAGLFTRNRVCAAPVTVTRKNIHNGIGRLIVANSGNANACTGLRGMRDALQTQREAAKIFGVNRSWVSVCSTGKIGEYLPMEKIKKGLVKAKGLLAPGSFLDAARGIMTTDQFAKYGMVKGSLAGKKYTIAVMTKGAGMLRPDVATMLTFIVTDLKFSRPVLQKIFRLSVDETLNRVTVDGDTSTNDTVLMLANGRAGNPVFAPNSPHGKKVRKQLTELLTAMARKITLDGEGATKCCRVAVTGARSEADAKKIAYAIGNSPLVKTALFGCDPNWGRIMAAIGYSGALINPLAIDIKIGPFWVARKGGRASGFKSGLVSRYLRKENVEITVHCGSGNAGSGSGSFYIFMSDLTYDYIHLNAEYHT